MKQGKRRKNYFRKSGKKQKEEKKCFTARNAEKRINGPKACSRAMVHVKCAERYGNAMMCHQGACRHNRKGGIKMTFTKRIQKAIEISATIHEGQYRKGTSVPYATHPFAAFLIGSKYTDDEDTLISILMHDGPEDTDMTFDRIKNEFGPDVSEIVRGVTKEKRFARLPWKEKEEKYLANLRSARIESMIVCASDKIHNMMSTINEYDGEGFWKRFAATKEQKIKYYENVLEVLKERISGGIIDEYEETLSRMKEVVS